MDDMDDRIYYTEIKTGKSNANPHTVSHDWDNGYDCGYTYGYRIGVEECVTMMREKDDRIIDLIKQLNEMTLKFLKAKSNVGE
jgi:hypothetical protein